MFRPPRPLRKRVAWAARTWARSTFSRDSFLSSLKSLLWVAPLTVLIWVYAEREQVVTLKGVAVSLEMRSNEAGRVVRVLSPLGAPSASSWKGRRRNSNRQKITWNQRSFPSRWIKASLPAKNIPSRYSPS